jgi:pyruvate dehydrogenase E1 component
LFNFTIQNDVALFEILKKYEKLRQAYKIHLLCKEKETHMSNVTGQDAAAPKADADHQETREWMDALTAVIQSEGPERAHALLEQLLEHARESSIDLPFSANTGYVNTIEADSEERCPGNIEIEERLRAYMRWNAMAMVVKANRHHPVDGGDLGGHIGSFASLAHLFGAGFNHFWHAENENHGGDLLYIQGHVSVSMPAPTWKVV